MSKPAHGDAVLIGLIGLMAVYAGLMTHVVAGPAFLSVGISLLAAAAFLYARAGPLPWTPSRHAERGWVTLACPVCESPLAWVDELGQWYCDECEGYLPAKPIRMVLELAR